MATEDIQPLLDQLDVDIDTVEIALKPLLEANIAETASTLPLLDKAKLHVLTTYAIESLIFSALQVKGIDAKKHPVWTELTRVKQYFAKIAEAEKNGDVSEKANRKLDKSAASRFIKHALAGNDRERDARAMTERANAQIKLQNLEAEIAEREAKSKKQAEKEEKQAAKEAKRERKRKAAEAELAAEVEAGVSTEATPDVSSTETPKKKSKKSKDKVKDKAKHKSDKPPKSHSEIFNDLVSRADKKKKKKTKSTEDD